MKRSYKLIKEYPGSPKLGSINNNNYIGTNCHPKDFPDYMELEKN